MAVVQLAVALHVRNMLIDAASEGARFGALAGNTPQQGAQRTRDLVGASLSQSYTQDVVARVDADPSGDIVVVAISAPLPVIGLFGPRRLVATGHAPVEGP